MRTLFAVVATLTLTTPALAQQQPAPPTCEAAEYRAFDFWIGEWDAFRADPEWQKVRAESEKDGPIVSKVESVYMTLTDYSPVK